MSLSNWLQIRRAINQCSCDVVGLDELIEWKIEPEKISHITGRFFYITGIRVSNPPGPIVEYPMIVQSEIGILGCLLAKDRVGIHILLQAKTEPGNIYGTQISPTVQATESNYKCVHGGKETHYLNNFIREASDSRLADSLQSEQGFKFLSKYNRNMIVITDRDDCILENENYAWFPLDEILEHLCTDFMFNTDFRSVLIASDWKVLCMKSAPFEQKMQENKFASKLYESYQGISASSCIKSRCLIEKLHLFRRDKNQIIEEVPLTELDAWEYDNKTIQPKNGCSTFVRGFNISIDSREVESWDQPLIESKEESLCILLAQMRGGVLMFLLRISMEPGFKNVAQWSSTIQNEFETWNDSEEKLGWILENPQQFTRRLRCKQSDEGGRFYQCVTEYQIVEISEDIDIEQSEWYEWASLQQIQELVRMEGMVTNELRSNLSLLLAYL